MTIFYEGERVEWAGGGFRAEGKIIMVEAVSQAAHVKWDTGPDAGRFTLVDLLDIEHVTAARVEDPDPLHMHAVRRAYDTEREVGVLNFLASNQYTSSWTKIAQDTLAFVEERIRTDASMDLVDEQLSAREKQTVVAAAALALLRDAFSAEDE